MESHIYYMFKVSNYLTKRHKQTLTSDVISECRVLAGT